MGLRDASASKKLQDQIKRYIPYIPGHNCEIDMEDFTPNFKGA